MAALKLPETVQVDKDLQDLMSNFIQNRINDLSSIESFVKEGNFSEARRYAHIIAGVAGGYGFAELGEYGREIESLIESKNSTKILSMVSELKVYMTIVNISYK